VQQAPCVEGYELVRRLKVRASDGVNDALLRQHPGCVRDSGSAGSLIRANHPSSGAKVSTRCATTALIPVVVAMARERITGEVGDDECVTENQPVGVYISPLWSKANVRGFS
jgi:hypothetical protein